MKIVSDMEETIEVPRWVLEHIEDTLRIQFNIYENKTDTCQKRNIKESLLLVAKLLNGIELSGFERTEKITDFIKTENYDRSLV